MWQIKSKALRERRHEKVWTVAQLAQEAKVSARTIVALEKSDRSVRASTLKDLAAAFKVTPQEIGRRVVDEETGKKAPAEAGAAPTGSPAPARTPAPLPVLRSYGPGVTEIPRLSRLEELVAIEDTQPPRPHLDTPAGPVPPLTARLFQDIFTAYLVHEGRRAYVQGAILAQRGMGDEQAAICKTKSGTGARFHFVFEVMPGHEVGVTVHTVRAEHTRSLQERLNRNAIAVVSVVAAPGGSTNRDVGFEFFMASGKAVRPWGLEVVDVLDVADAPAASATAPIAKTARAASPAKAKAKAAKKPARAASQARR